MVIALGATNDPAGRIGVGITRRPKDRKAQITRAATETFSALGYHAASMEAIAAKVGISAPALYRHYPNKYEMFAVVVSMFGDQLVDCTAFIDEVSDGELDQDAAGVLDRAVDALITLAIRDREAGGLYRWQARYLQPDHRAKLMGQLATVGGRLQRPLGALRPGLTSWEGSILSTGLLSIAGTIIRNQLKLRPPDDQVRALVMDAARALVATQLPKPDDVGVNRPAVWRIFTPDAGPYEALLHSAILLFGRQGYAETSVTEIAEAVGIPASGVYRFFSSKSDVLATGLQRAVDRFAGEMSAIAGVFVEPEDALTRLIEAYTATVFANPELAAVYDTERVNLAPPELALLWGSERAFLDTWAKPLMVVRPDLDGVRAKSLVYASLGLVNDMGRMAREAESYGDGSTPGGPGYTQACLRNLMESILLGAD
ncbi:MAG: TetR/AcrR family transcriptional regulator [Mycobacterium sp.]